ncbi:MAG: UDP-N-acetylglucosamine pyrophosphorylase, partial [Cutibacterium granulosum]|nr:UDP-N-acetylglucosamine pyrophosphorylase [Cutibacterium granulosum]
MDNRGAATVEALIAKGVEIPNPSTVDITDDVDPDLISAEGVVIHPGCRIRGSRT